MSSRFSNYKLSSYGKTQKKKTGNDMSSDEMLMNEIINEEKK